MAQDKREAAVRNGHEHTASGAIDWDRLIAANAPLNAFVDWDRQAAAVAGPLEGLTIGVKANIAVAGLPWTAGMALFRTRIAAHDATTVRLLREAGAAIIGTCNMDEAAYGTHTDNPWFGATHNPHALVYTAGGSSGGSGAAVAAGLCDAALGTDTMGSVRIPAAYCGVYGFKPANAAVSQDGLELCGPTLDVIGPIARSLDMLERVARVMSKFGDRSGEVTAATLSGLGGVACDPDVEATYRCACAELSADARFALSYPVARILTAGFLACARPTAVAFREADPALLSDRLKDLIAYGPARSDAEWAEDQEVLATTRTEMRAAVARHGILVMPTTPSPPLPLGTPSPTQADFCSLANIAGLPAISIPAGWSGAGLPIGVQLVGREREEQLLFDVASRLDAALDAYRPPACE